MLFKVLVCAYMKDAHMNNSQLKPGYNVQFAANLQKQHLIQPKAYLKF